jgi:hypothetical protein
MPFSYRCVRFAAVSVLLCGLTVGLAPRAQAQELISPALKDRKFPVGTWCPMPVDLAFTANGDHVTIRYSTNVYYDDPSNGVTWTQQYLDNVCVAPQQVYLDNLHDRVEGTASEFCYIFPGETLLQRFQIQDVSGVPLKDLFDTDPAGRWDLDHGAYWEDSTTAANNPGPEDDFDPLGCLGLGRDQTPRSLADSAYTSVTVTGLTNGANYVLTGWWYVRNMDLNEVFLTTRVYGVDGPTPIAIKTWGAVKRQYR